eukprot:10720007-Prorocentrum_lima.AAC.1
MVKESFDEESPPKIARSSLRGRRYVWAAPFSALRPMRRRVHGIALDAVNQRRAEGQERG